MDDREKPPCRVVRPIQRNMVLTASHVRTAERGERIPTAVAFIRGHLISGGTQCRRIPFARLGKRLHGIVEKVKVLRKPRRLSRRVEHQAASKMAGFGTVGHNHGQNLTLEIGQRHYRSFLSFCESFQAAWLPYSRRRWITKSTSSKYFTRASGCLNQKHWISYFFTNASARSINSGGAGILGGSVVDTVTFISATA